MGGVTNTNIPALCGHTPTGSLTTTVAGGGVSRIQIDNLVGTGTILGPGSDYVYCDDFRVSIAGDSVAAHAPCPIPGDHCATLTIGDPTVTIKEPLGIGVTAPYDPSLDPLPDIEVILFSTLINPLTSNIPLVGYTGPITFVGSIANNTSTSVGAFNIGLFSLQGIDMDPTLKYNLQRSSAGGGANVALVAEQRIPFLQAGQVIPVTFFLPSYTILIPFPQHFLLAVDIDNEHRERDEGENTSDTLTITAV